MNSLHDEMSLTVDRKKPWAPVKTKLVHHRNHLHKSCKNENKIVLWFEVDDTGCGMTLEFLNYILFIPNFPGSESQFSI